ncbi:uncharacterized protein [Chelonus insularis]|uniref:uncharacterized protein n=1 Tax=Chelonus insularis TaxID=460826 RepID=UPI0015894E52|nr:uncharacterized protein LOC118074828 [Chelonus insularis]
MVSQFHTNNNKLVLKNSNSMKVFECLKLMNEKEKMLEEYKEEICLPDNYYKRKNQDLKAKIIQRLPLIRRNSVKLEDESSFTKYVTCNTMEKEKYSVDDNNRDVFENNICERMRGGGVNKELEKLSISPISPTKISIKDFCKPNHEENQPGCGCYGKSEAITMKSGLGCINTPCIDIDCLIQKLKEAQEFVNSLGKVPGIQGLGLMDPADSPYFNRNCQNLDTTYTNKQLSLSNEQKQSNLVEYDESVPIEKKEVKYGPCGKVTCMSKKANFEDDVLQFPDLSSTQNSSLKNIKKTKLQKNKSKSSKKHSKTVSKSQSLDLRPNYVHISKKIMKLVNSTRPRFYYGHKSCVDVRMRVPGNMGWLWNTRETIGKLKPQVGWKPGAISRNAWNSLEDAKIERTSEDMRDRPSTPVRGKRAKGTKRKHLFFPSKHYWGQRARDDEYQLPPTLHIHRKTGDYYVTFYPINKELINKPEEQQTIKPLHFHIRKNKNLDFSDDSSSTASDMEIEFSPPAATTRYQKKVDTRDVDTLVYQNDITESIKEILPEIQSKKKKKTKKTK